jgi:hypothetical protein
MNSTIAKPLHALGPLGPARTAARASASNTWVNVGIFFAAHVPLALLMFRFDQIATVHAMLTPIIGALWLLSKRHLERAAYLGAYITGAEVLWRMTDAQVFWEFGKYSMVGLFVLAMLRAGRIKWSPLPLMYFLLLLPSCLLTFQYLGMEYARKSLSFNLSGPFALMVSVWFFSNLRITQEQLHRMFLALVGPAVGIASITAFTTFSSTAIKFSAQSNKLTSGGFGPNQVSAILGLGFLLAMFFLMNSRSGFGLKGLMFGTMVLLGVQSALTFSRGGLYMAAGGALLGLLYLIRDSNSRIRIVLVITAIFVVTNYVLLPSLDTFTGGSLSSRFEDTNPTGRDEIILIDLQIWAENPILGVGPGIGMIYRAQAYKFVAAHTEFTRLLAEHGIFGALALLLLLVMAVQSIRRSKTIIGKALAASMLGWSILFMMIDAMRLAAPALAFGLSFVTILPKANLPSIIGRRPFNRGTHHFNPRLAVRTGAMRHPGISDDKRAVSGGIPDGRG